jgi:hypothetical protein
MAARRRRADDHEDTVNTVNIRKIESTRKIRRY